MAKKQQRPGRTLVVFFLGVGIAFGLVALTGTWSPQLGLDLEGGTRITLQAKGNPTQDSLDEARNIIDNRVNGSGVAEAAVSTQGGGIISVEIPGDQRRDLIDTVERQAQLRFRLVACSDLNPCIAQSGSTDPSQVTPEIQIPTDAPSAGATGNGGNGNGGNGGNGNGGNGGNGANPRVAPGFALDGTATPTDAPSDEPTDEPTDTPTDTPTDQPAEEGTLTEDFDNSAVADLDEEIAFMRGGYTQEDVDLFNAYVCDDQGILLDAQTGEAANLPDDPLKPLVACSPPEEGSGSADDPGQPSFKYLLSRAIIQGTDLDDAGFGIPQGQVGYAVTLDIGGDGRQVFSDASSKLTLDVEQFAIVLDGQVISAPTFNGRIPDGSAQISGNFSETEAESLSTSLKFGALPISFEEPSSDTIGPSLAGDQLRAGLTAGGIGLALVMLYCLLYYRGLGLVVIASLGVAAAITYAMVLLLSETAGFTLTLPGVAGLIIAVGITADSFIILFERIRDEMRDGKSMRVAVESGWVRARNTALAADAVSLLAAVVLYLFASGVVKGFAFALGLTTLIDLVVFFYFTKPMVSYLARYSFFNKGHRLSGLSAATLGTDVAPAVPAGGKA